MWRYVVLLLLSVACAGCVTPSPMHGNFCSDTTCQRLPQDVVSFTFRIDPAFSQEEAADIRYAVAAWQRDTHRCVRAAEEVLSGANLFFRRANSLRDVPFTDDERDVVDPTTVGYWLQRRLEIWMLPQYACRSINGPQGCDIHVARQSMAAHELGHAFGLGHTPFLRDGQRSCMSSLLVGDCLLDGHVPQRDVLVFLGLHPMCW